MARKLQTAAASAVFIRVRFPSTEPIDMKERLFAFCAFAAALPAAVHAQDSPKSDWSVSGNVGVFSDYRFRGISQTDKKPAIQGGFDVAGSEEHTSELQSPKDLVCRLLLE